jgi:NADH-quinone oxidoreductase subunit C
MQATPWESELTKELQRNFPGHITEFLTYRGQEFFVCVPEAVVSILEYLKLAADFDYLVDITAVDYPQRDSRFELLYVVYSFSRNQRIRMKTRITADFTPASAVSVYPGANWLEREVFDMFGIRFSGHPDLRRILLPEEWHGHPLRKDTSILAMDNDWVKANLGIESGQ